MLKSRKQQTEVVSRVEPIWTTDPVTHDTAYSRPDGATGRDIIENILVHAGCPYPELVTDDICDELRRAGYR